MVIAVSRGILLSHPRNGKEAVGEWWEWEGDQRAMGSGMSWLPVGSCGHCQHLALPLGEMGVGPCFWRTFLSTTAPPPLVALEKVTGESDQFGREKGSPAHAQSRISCGVERDLGDPREWLVKSDRSSALECQGSQTHPLTLVTAPLSLVISPILNQTLGKHETALWGRMAGWFRSTRGEQGTSAHRL